MGRQTLPDDERPWAKSRGLEAVKLIPGTPLKPRGLSEAAGHYWDELIEQMAASGITLIPGDSSIVAMAATIKADLQVAWAHIQKNGRYTVSKTGVEKLSSAVEDTAKLNEKLSKCLWQLGLTPKSRGNQVKAIEPDEDDDLADILDGDGTPGSAKRKREGNKNANL
jgi:phage terminase small subunit